MQFELQYLLLALAPVFLGFIAWEAWYLNGRGEQFPSARYTWPDTLSNAALALMHEGAEAVAAIVLIYVYDAVFAIRLFDIPATWWSFILLFVLQDFCYYWFHRGSHRIRWMWASHVVHHSSESLNLSTAFRQSLTYPVSGMWLFWLPVILVGFTPQQAVTMVMLSLAFQFFIHTQVVKRLGWLEAVFNTPSHHRVHHARNPEYIDMNFAGILIVWDKVFGTFVAEKEESPCEYGVVKQVRSHNPLILTFHEWRDMWRDARAPGLTLGGRLRALFGPPESAPSETLPQAQTKAQLNATST
ncbi:sterol desaturase family protein [Hahella sp. NBU794]|uniref:sterol desaturase family protein n=1 Tax=Hahella sp. NBU794 TaxID=3422590 RepID=UPI003D6F3F12